MRKYSTGRRPVGALMQHDWPAMRELRNLRRLLLMRFGATAQPHTVAGQSGRTHGQQTLRMLMLRTSLIFERPDRALQAASAVICSSASRAKHLRHDERHGLDKATTRLQYSNRQALRADGGLEAQR